MDFIDRRIFMSGTQTASSWLFDATVQAIVSYFGSDYGVVVVNTIDQYLNGLPFAYALQIADLINTYAVEDAGIVYNLVPSFNVDRYFANEDGVAYIDTGIKSNYTYTYKLRCAITETTTEEKGLFGQFTSNARLFITIQNNYFQSGYGAYFNSNIKPVDYAMHDWEQAIGILKCDGVDLVTNPTGTWTAQNNALLLSRSGITPIKGKVVSAELSSNDTKVAEFYPFVRNGVVGAINIVNNTFIPPTVGTLTLGVQSR